VRGLSIDLVRRDIVEVFSNNGFGNLPDLNKIVLGGAADHPGFVRIPAKIGKMVSVASVHE